MTIARDLFVVVVVVMLWNIIKIIVPTKIKKGNKMKEYNVDYKYVICFNVVEEDEDKAKELVEKKMYNLLNKLNEDEEYTGKVKGVWLSDVLEEDVIHLQEETYESVAM